MIVYEVAKYGEYAADEVIAIYASRDTRSQDLQRQRAIARAKDELREKLNCTDISFIQYTDSHMLVLCGEWSEESFHAWRHTVNSSYWWYFSPFNHEGVIGITEIEVLE